MLKKLLAYFPNPADHKWFLFLLIGGVLALAAFIDEVPKIGIKIRGSEYQPLLLVCGAALLLAAIVLVIHDAFRPPVVTTVTDGPSKGKAKVNVKAVAAIFDTPKPGPDGKLRSPVALTGTVAKPPPEDWSIYLVGVGKRDNHKTYWPYAEVQIKNKRHWSLDYKSGEGDKDLRLYIVGKDGKALMDAFFDINREHLKKNPGSHEPLWTLTSDMLEAAALHVKVEKPI
jgi:hypothetical protein